MKSLFNFYLEDDVKIKIQDKLIRLNGEKQKGQVAALIRVLLKQFLATADENTKIELLNAIDAEYETSAKLNKRSKL